MTKIDKRNGKWVFVAAVKNILLKKAINYEFTIRRVTFVSGAVLAHRRKRYGFPTTLADLKTQSKGALLNFFDNQQTYALLRESGVAKNVKDKCLSLIEEELSIISASQLGFGRRRYNAAPVLSDSSNFRSYFLLDDNNECWTQNNEIINKIGILFLEDNWVRYGREGFFFKLLDLIRSNKTLPAWRNDLKNAAILIGQSQATTDLPQAFLWNVIALETLLTEKHEVISEQLPSRVEAFIGWVYSWKNSNSKDRLRQIYKKRCEFVHDGCRENIKIDDVLFTDVVLLNLLINIVKHPKLFKSKQDIINFSKRIEAEYVLGQIPGCRIKPKVRPKTLEYYQPIYNDKDFEKI